MERIPGQLKKLQKKKAALSEQYLNLVKVDKEQLLADLGINPSDLKENEKLENGPEIE